MWTSAATMRRKLAKRLITTSDAASEPRSGNGEVSMAIRSERFNWSE